MDISTGSTVNTDSHNNSNNSRNRNNGKKKSSSKSSTPLLASMSIPRTTTGVTTGGTSSSETVLSATVTTSTSITIQDSLTTKPTPSFQNILSASMTRNSSTSSFISSGLLNQSQMSSRQTLIRRQNNLLRRTSSFGGGPVVIAQPPPVPIHKVQSSSYIRWIVLFLSCLLLFGNYYAYDNPAALNKPLQEHLGHDYDQYQYELNLLYSVYSFPNMFLPVIGGQMVDRMDPKRVLLIFSGFVCAGQTIFSWGVSLKIFWIMVLGRILFGIGGESISVIQASITTSWFKNKELAFALGLNLSIARFGSVVNANMSPRIEKSLGVPAAVWTGTLMCFISFASAGLLVLILKTHSPKDSLGYLQVDLHSSVDDDNQLESSHVTFVDQDESILGHLKRCWESLFLFPFTFWLVCLICVMLYSTVVPFNNIASDFLMSKWYPGDTISAGFAMSIPDTISAFLVPISGYFVDRYGGRPVLLIICSLVIACVHFTLGWTMVNPIIPLVFLGISYSIYGVAIWPSIATIIEHHENTLVRKDPNEPNQKLLGTAYGISTSVLNTGLTLMPVLAAQARVWGGSFTTVELFFVILAFFGGVASVVLYLIDRRNGSILQMPELEKETQSDTMSPTYSTWDHSATISSDDTSSSYHSHQNGGILYQSSSNSFTNSPRKSASSPLKPRYSQEGLSDLHTRGQLLLKKYGSAQGKPGLYEDPVEEREES